jgi:hypothetical protein
MNRKLYAISLAAVFLAISFLTSCSSSSSTPPPPPPATTTPFAFYLSGQEAPNTLNGSQLSYYSLAGAVTINASGTVTGGEQDYNDGFAITSPEPSGDSITGGTLTVDATTGQGTLTLITNNTNVGVAGTETLSVQFVNADHALITQYDGTATSSGSLDLQTLSATPSGGFAFTMNGVDTSYAPIAFGGVFTLPAAATDEVDANDDGTITAAAALTGTVLSAPDAYGRGTVTTSLEYGTTPILFNYYVVGAETIRIIDVDATDAAVGSAYGQGSSTGAFANSTLVNSIFGVLGDPWGMEYATAGQIVTDSTPTPATYTGIAEDAEMETFLSAPASEIGGTYTINANGYGSMTVGGFGGGDVAALQVYATDPTLDLMDPNNVGGNPDVGGALVLDFDANLAGGIGTVVTQTDTTSTDFNGTYAAGWQNYNDLVAASACYGCEFDMVAQGTMASGGALSLTAQISDPSQTLDAGGTTGPGTFTGTPTPDTTNLGRLTMLSTDAAPGGPLTASIGTSPITSFDVVMYQASASQLYWLEFDYDSVFLGYLEVQGSLSSVPAVKRAAKVQAKH